MRNFFAAIIGSVLSWWGLTLVSVLDSTVFFFTPFAIDLVVVLLAARNRNVFWLYPIIATAGSLVGSAVTYYMGKRLGEAGLKHFVSERRLDRFRCRIRDKGAIALAVLNLAPPPFPFTAFVLVAGALEVSPAKFFLTLAPTRLVRFGGEAVLAFFYGEQIVNWLKSDIVTDIGLALVALMVIGSIFTAVRVIHHTRAHRNGGKRSVA